MLSEVNHGESHFVKLESESASRLKPELAWS